ncbi:MAG TPA: pyrimidine dimer DNA glycosylase/endonuclease V [Gammaproteobacteria bacterium]
MRLWSLHPKYLDAKGLVALWREALLAQAVLSGETRGYTRHPQLIRFRESPAPLAAIAFYLQEVYAEAVRRGYRFDNRKIGGDGSVAQIPVTHGQLAYEWSHLQVKLAQRDPARLEAQKYLDQPEPHPLFRVVPGPVAAWEVVQERR